MLHKTLVLAIASLSVMLATSSEVQAWGAAHVGYTHVGPGGVYHAGGTAAYGGYGAYRSGGAYHYGAGGYGAAYGGAYRYGVGGYGAGGYGGYSYGGVPYGGYRGYDAGYVRRW